MAKKSVVVNQSQTDTGKIKTGEEFVKVYPIGRSIVVKDATYHLNGKTITGTITRVGAWLGPINTAITIDVGGVPMTVPASLVLVSDADKQEQ